MTVVIPKATLKKIIQQNNSLKTKKLKWYAIRIFNTKEGSKWGTEEQNRHETYQKQTAK